MAAASDLERRARNAFIEYRYDRAVALFSEAIALQPGNEDKASLLAFRSRANLELDKIYDACADAVAAHEIDPHLIVAKILMGDCLMKCNKYGSAGNCYSSALENPTDDPRELLGQLMAIPAGSKLIRAIRYKWPNNDLMEVLLPKMKICLELAEGEPHDYYGDLTSDDITRLISVRGKLAGQLEGVWPALCLARQGLVSRNWGQEVGSYKERSLHRDNYPQRNLDLNSLEDTCQFAKDLEDTTITRMRIWSRLFGGISRQLDMADVSLEGLGI